MRASVIRSFRHRYLFLSNFYPCKIVVDGHQFQSVEHAYQAQKTDKENWHIFDGIGPGAAKRLGRSLKSRDDWNEVKIGIMKSLLVQKFKDARLAGLLLATGDRMLIEGNTWGDDFWGVHTSEGKNHLGRLLMEVRKELCAKANL